MLRHLQEPRLGRGARHPGHRPHLAVAQRAGGEGRVDQRKLAELPGHAHLLGRRHRPDPHSPAEPVDAALRALPRPAAEVVEPSNFGQQLVRRRVDAGGVNGNGVSELIYLGPARSVRRSPLVAYDGTH
jgi:hypothetical protein